MEKKDCFSKKMSRKRTAEAKETEILSSLFNTKIYSHPAMLPRWITKSDLAHLGLHYVASQHANSEQRTFVFVSKVQSKIVAVWLYSRSEEVKVLQMQPTEPTEDVVDLSILDADIMSDGVIWVSDLLMMSNEAVWKYSVLIRMEKLREFFRSWKGIGERTAGYIDPQICKTDRENIPCVNIEKGVKTYCLMVKPNYPFDAVRNLQESDEFDGFVFTRLLTPYSPYGSDTQACLRWSSVPTVDFHVSVNREKTMPVTTFEPAYDCVTRDTKGEYKLKCQSGDELVHVANTSQIDKTLLHMRSDFIGEFLWHGKWQFVRLRDDCVAPNTIQTLQSTLDAILHPISLQHIYEAVGVL